MMHLSRVRRRLAFSVLAFSLLCAGNALAQGGATSTRPPDLRVMVESVKKTADTLGMTLRAMPEKLRETTRSAEDAIKQLDSMQESARAVADTLAESSDFWAEFKALQRFSDERWQQASQRLSQTGEERWRKRVADWDAQRANLRRIEQDVIQERARAGRQLDAIARDRDFIVDSMTLQKVEDAVAELEKARQQLAAMNNGVQSILDNLNGMAKQSVAN